MGQSQKQEQSKKARINPRLKKKQKQECVKYLQKFSKYPNTVCFKARNKEESYIPPNKSGEQACHPHENVTKNRSKEVGNEGELKVKDLGGGGGGGSSAPQERVGPLLCGSRRR